MEKSTVGKLFLLAVLSASSAAALADSAALFGLGVGRSEVDMDDYDVSGKSTAWEIYGGWQFNRYVSVEAGYIDGGTPKDNIEGVTVEADTSALVASVVGSLPLGDTFSVYGRAGVMHWESEQEARVEGATIASGDFDGDDPFFGAGVAAALEGALVRLEYRMASLDDSDLTLLSLGMAWRF